MKQRSKDVRAGLIPKKSIRPNSCVCGCGASVSPQAKWNRACWIANKRRPILCACGCGEFVKSLYAGSKVKKGHFTPEMRARLSAAKKRDNPMKRPDVAARVAAKLKGVKRPDVSAKRKQMYADGRLRPYVITPEERALSAERMRRQNPMRRPEIVEKVRSTSLASGAFARRGEASRKFWAENPEFKERARERMRTRNPMFDLDTREKSLSQTRQHLQASQLEQWFGRFCIREAFPVWYTGTGEFWVKARNPDFKIHDRKLVIEVTDGYNRTPERRTVESYAEPTIRHYQKHGFECLVVMLPARRQNRTTTLQASLACAMRTFLSDGQSMVWNFVK
jgi:hypothetical protein